MKIDTPIAILLLAFAGCAKQAPPPNYDPLIRKLAALEASVAAGESLERLKQALAGVSEEMRLAPTPTNTDRFVEGMHSKMFMIWSAEANRRQVEQAYSWNEQRYAEVLSDLSLRRETLARMAGDLRRALQQGVSNNTVAYNWTSYTNEFSKPQDPRNKQKTQ